MNNPDSSPNSPWHKIVPPLQWFLAFIGAIDCLATSTLFSLSQVSTFKLSNLLPLPGLYFLEISLISIAVLVSLMRTASPRAFRWSLIPWISAGVLQAFVILGALSIGFFLIPALIAYLAIGVITAIRRNQNILQNLGIFLITAILQADLIYLLAQANL